MPKAQVSSTSTPGLDYDYTLYNNYKGCYFIDLVLLNDLFYSCYS